jgi:hypothetical protein
MSEINEEWHILLWRACSAEGGSDEGGEMTRRAEFGTQGNDKTKSSHEYIKW